MVQNLLAAALMLYIRFVFLTCRKQYLLAPEAEPYLKGEKNALFAFWHGRLMMVPMLRPPGRRMHAMISLHSDGRFIARAMRYLGASIISGSTSRGGTRAAAGAIRMLLKGDNIGITPDGPRGPACRAQPGIARIASRAGVPVVPLSFSASRCKTMRSWDGFRLALPFGRLVFAAGAPIAIAPQTGKEELAITTRRIEESINTITQKADDFIFSATPPEIP